MSLIATDIYIDLMHYAETNNPEMFITLFDLYAGANFTDKQLNELLRVNEEILKSK